MTKIHIIMESEDTSAYFRIFIDGDSSWLDEGVEEKLAKLNIVLEINPILTYGKETFYGFEDDGQIGFYIPTDTLLRYAGDILSKVVGGLHI